MDANALNYIYYGSARELFQTTASYIPAFTFQLSVRRHREFRVDNDELALRTPTRFGSFTGVLDFGLFLVCAVFKQSQICCYCLVDK
jgi:hypothetical protein